MGKTRHTWQPGTCRRAGHEPSCLLTSTKRFPEAEMDKNFAENLKKVRTCSQRSNSQHTCRRSSPHRLHVRPCDKVQKLKNGGQGLGSSRGLLMDVSRETLPETVDGALEMSVSQKYYSCAPNHGHMAQELTFFAQVQKKYNF